jgi:ribosomal protein S7
MVDALVEEIIGAYENNPTKSEAIREKERIEKEAEGAR